MVTIRYSDQQRSKSQQNRCQVQPTENIGNLSASRRCLWVRTTVSTVWSAASISKSEIQATGLSGVSNKVIKGDTKKSLSSRRGTRRQVMRHFSSNGIDQCLYIISSKLKCLCSLSMFTPPIITVLTIFPLSGGCSETLAGFVHRIEGKSSFYSKQYNNRALIIYW